MFNLKWSETADETYKELKKKAEQIKENRALKKIRKSSKQEGLFKQVHGCITKLRTNPSHPGLDTKPFRSLDNPYNKNENVYESYAQNRTPGAYRVFWCYGPDRNWITLIAITPHP